MMTTFSPALALHPLITDDTGAQGKGYLELEFGYQYDHDSFKWIDSHPESILAGELQGQSNLGRVLNRDEANTITLTLAYGIIDNFDVVIGLPYQYTKTRERRTYFSPPLQFVSLKSTTTASGLSDVITEFKWKFYEYKMLSLALKPGIIFPVGDAYRGLGVGKPGGYGYVIATADLTPVVMHLNLGYLRNQNILNEREDIWHASLAFEFWVVKDRLRLVTNFGFERNRYKWSNFQDVFVLGGIVVSPTENIDIDFGFNYRFLPRVTHRPGAQYNYPAGIATRPDYSLLGGLTMRFHTGSGDDGREKNEKEPVR
jgi:hypothetical protein